MTPWLAFAGAWVLHVALAFTVPLFADEAYYLAWSRALAPGYLDHPPGVALWVSLGHPRLAGVTILPAAWWLLADAARRWGVDAWRWIPALLMWTPLGAGAALVATPDAPLVASWCLVLWAVACDRASLAGVAFGLCLWSKSTALVALPGLLWVLRERAALALPVAALVYAPHVVWSFANDGLPWSFQAAARAVTGFHLHEALGGQLLVVTPGVCLLAAARWWRPADDIDRRLRALGLPVLVVWLLAACVTRVEANWPALAWPATAVLLLRRPSPRLLHAGLLAAALSVGAAVVLWSVGPRTWGGPPRDGPRLLACLDAASPRPRVAARYQEKALLDLAGPPTPYLRARGHRPSEYDRRSTPAVPACDFIYLASADALAGRCAGTVTESRPCGRAVAECLCER